MDFEDRYACCALFSIHQLQIHFKQDLANLDTSKDKKKEI